MPITVPTDDVPTPVLPSAAVPASDEAVAHECNPDNEVDPSPGTPPEQQRVKMEVHASIPAPLEPPKSKTQRSNVQEPSEPTSHFNASGKSASVTLKTTQEATQHPSYVLEILSGQRRPSSYMEAAEAHSADSAACYAGQTALAARDSLAAQTNPHTTHTVAYIPHLDG